MKGPKTPPRADNTGLETVTGFLKRDAWFNV